MDFSKFMDTYGDGPKGPTWGGDTLDGVFDAFDDTFGTGGGRAGGGRAPVGIKNEADSFIGSDGSGLSDYIQREQGATHRSLGDDLDDVDKRMQCSSACSTLAWYA